MLQKAAKKLNKACLIIACVHFLLTFLTDRVIFQYHLCDFSSLVNAAKSVIAIGSKIAFFFVLIILWQAGYYFVKKADRKFVKYTLIYLGIMGVLLLLTYPGIFRMDEFGLLFEAQKVSFEFWQNYMTSVFYIMALMLTPVPAGVVLWQCIFISLIVGYLIYKTEQLQLIKGKWVYALYLPFLFFPVLDSNLYPMRMSLYAFLELLLLAKLVFFRMEKKQLMIKDLIGTILLSAVVITWRSEAVYYFVAIPVCFVAMLYSYTSKEVKRRFIFWMLVASLLLFIPQQVGNKLRNGEQYTLTSMVLPVVPLVDAAYTESLETSDEEVKEELELLLSEVDKVLNVEVTVEGYRNGKNGIAMFWSESEFKRAYTSEEFKDFEKAYTKLLLRYPLVFLKERVETFLQSEDLLENTTVIYEDTGVLNHEKFAALFANRPLHKELRKTVISILELRSLQDYNMKSPIYSFVYHVIPPLSLLLILFLVLLLKRKWAYALLLGAHLCKVPLIFITAPSRLFMYYYPVYLVGVFTISVIVIHGISQKGVWGIRRAGKE